MNYRKITAEKFGIAMAGIMDDDIIFGLDDNAWRWHKRIMKKEVGTIVFRVGKFVLRRL